jgi:hypothetical protein
MIIQLDEFLRSKHLALKFTHSFVTDGLCCAVYIDLITNITNILIVFILFLR